MALPKKDIDKIDKQIIMELQEDARRPFKNIAARLKVSESTVSNRVNRLKERNVLKLEASVNPFKLPHKISALIGINLERMDHQKAIEQIEKLPEVTAVFSVTGKYDLFAEVMLDSISELNEFIFMGGLNKAASIKATESFMILDSKTKFFKLS